MGHELRSRSQYEEVKTISINRFQVAMPIDDRAEPTGDLVIKCQLGKPFDEFRKTMKNENIDGLFKKSCFGYFLELPEDHTAHFQMSIVYGLLKCKIKYVEDDKGSEEGKKGWMKFGSTTVPSQLVLA
ncbi:hypothetical protein FXO38_17526 [Capsicum annuum]|nr:hypothetical protein FXO38_17526 [Capsicum annuum]